MVIYLIDNRIDRNDLGEKKPISDDTGRTKLLREAFSKIAETYKSKVSFIDNLQVYSQKVDDNCSNIDRFVQVQQPYILFIHTSNKCFTTFVNNLMSDKSSDNWIVCYSGAPSEPAEYSQLNKNDFQNIRFIGGVGPADENIVSKWDIPAFVKAVLDKNQYAFDLLPRLRSIKELNKLCLNCMLYRMYYQNRNIEKLIIWADLNVEQISRELNSIGINEMNDIESLLDPVRELASQSQPAVQNEQNMEHVRRCEDALKQFKDRGFL